MRISDWSSDVCSSDLHIVKQRLGSSRQLDTESGQTPEDRQQAAVDETDLVTHEIRLFREYRRHAGQAFTQLFASLRALRLSGPLVTDTVGRRTPISDRKRVVEGEWVSRRVEFG